MLHSAPMARRLPCPSASRHGLSFGTLRSGQELLTIVPPGPLVNAIAFSPDGKRLVAAGESEAGEDLIWDWSVQRTD